MHAHLEKERELIRGLKQLNKTLAWHVRVDKSIAGRWVRAALRTPSLDNIENLIEHNFLLLNQTDNIDLINEIQHLNHNIHAVFHKSPQKAALLAKLQELTVKGDTRVIHEIETEMANQIPEGYFPLFKRDTKGHLLEPAKQLQQFRTFLVESLKALGDPVQADHIERDHHFSVKIAVKVASHLADLAFLACFGGLFERMRVPLSKDLHKAAKQGREWFHTHYANPQKFQEWEEQFPAEGTNLLPTFLSQPVYARHIVPSEIAYLRNKSIHFVNRIATLPPQLSSNKNIYLVIINRWGGKIFPKELYDLPLYFLSITTDSSVNLFPPGLSQLKETLNVFNCSGPTVYQLPEELFHLINLTFLSFDNSSIESLSPKIANLNNLKHLKLDNNPFLEKLPPEIGQLTHLQTFSCKGCDLLELPAEIGHCKGLVNLDVSENPRLTRFPKELGHLKNLEILLCDSTAIPFLPHELTHCHKLIQIGHDWHINSGIPLAEFLGQPKRKAA